MATKTTTRKRTTKKAGPKVDAYQIITDSIIAALEAGVVPWRKPWDALTDGPRSLSSRKAYRGVNVFMLLWTAQAKGYTSPWWGTFKQIQALGGQVRKGEKGTPVVFWRMLEVKDDTAKGGKRTIPMLRYFVVFNSEQADDVKVPALPQPREHTPVEEAERVVADYTARGPAYKIGGDRAYYQPSLDVVVTPKPQAFKTVEAYYSVLFHELAHSTGHADRLKRDGILNLDSTFGDETYGKEELIAEMGAAFVCGTTGIEPQIEMSAGYIAGWLRALRAEPKLLVQAAGAAQRAATLIVGEAETDEEEQA